MIELRIKDYCHNCPEFEVRSDRILGSYVDNKPTHTDNIVYCKHANKCARIEEYLEKRTNEKQA